MSTAAYGLLRRRTPLAACLYAALALEALHATPVLATTRSVTNCNDSGSGSLRGVVALSANNDTVSLSGLSACTITLSSGEIPIGNTVSNLTIQGPNGNNIAISGGQNYRVFHHYGTGTLYLNHLVITDGKYHGTDAKGACVLSAGSVSLNSTTVTDCNAYATTGIAQGGGIYAHGGVTMTTSNLSGNIAQSEGNGAYGGAVHAASFTAAYSNLQNNYAKVPNGGSANSGANFQGGSVWVGTGATDITYTTISGSSAVGPKTAGGCVYAKGTAYIATSHFDLCLAYANYTAQGGAISIGGNLTLERSIVENSHGGGGSGAYGAGVRANSVTMGFSTIHNNYLGGGPNGFSGLFEGGGLFVYQGTANIKYSTIDGNSTLGIGGGVFGVHSNITISDSTVSGNEATSFGSALSGTGGGIAMQATPGTAATLKLYNSTIAFNQVPISFGPYGGAGVRAYGTVVLQSTIIADNTKAGAADDFSCLCGIPASPTISGNNNLAMAIDPAGTQPPFGVIAVFGDPRLVPLGNHGGRTAVHALDPSSPAVGTGNNVYGSNSDQRGVGFARNVGSATDIGAYERQTIDDEIFYDGLGH